jgi:hypothetical protein
MQQDKLVDIMNGLRVAGFSCNGRIYSLEVLPLRKIEAINNFLKHPTAYVDDDLEGFMEYQTPKYGNKDYILISLKNKSADGMYLPNFLEKIKSFPLKPVSHEVFIQFMSKYPSRAKDGNVVALGSTIMLDGRRWVLCSYFDGHVIPLDKLSEARDFSHDIIVVEVLES